MPFMFRHGRHLHTCKTKSKDLHSTYPYRHQVKQWRVYLPLDYTGVSPCVPTYPLESIMCRSTMIKHKTPCSYRYLYFRIWLHGLFSADNRNSSRTFLLEVYQHAVFEVTSPTRIRGFELWPRSLEPEHTSAVFSRPSLPWSLRRGTDALLSPWWVSRHDEID